MTEDRVQITQAEGQKTEFGEQISDHKNRSLKIEDPSSPCRARTWHADGRGITTVI
jgi:hypothetical protein